jgi:hypothetical protein
MVTSLEEYSKKKLAQLEPPKAKTPKRVTKCRGGHCPIKTRCLRFTAPQYGWQSWLNGRVNIKMHTCEDFMRAK